MSPSPSCEKPSVLVVDGQGGGIGRALVERIKNEKLPVRTIAIGTNSAATSAMIKAGADDAATGENAIIYNSSMADFIAGPIGIVSANSMLGEISPAIAAALASSKAPKLLIPLNKCGIYVAGMSGQNLSEQVGDVVAQIRKLL